MEVKDILALLMTFIFFSAIGFMWWHTRKEEMKERQNKKEDV